jgi:hypothetical protein
LYPNLLLPVSSVLVLRPASHLQDHACLAFDGIPVITVKRLNFTSDGREFVVVRKAGTVSDLCSQGNSQVNYLVPLLLLVDPHLWPIGVHKTTASNIPMLGLPFEDGHIAFRIRKKNSFSISATTRLNSSFGLGAFSSYGSGDYFKIRCQVATTDFTELEVFFLFAFKPKRRSTWEVNSISLRFTLT